MLERNEVLQTVYLALQNNNPKLLSSFDRYFDSWESMLEFRRKLSGIIINPAYHDVLIEWLYNQSSEISRTAKIITTFLNDHELFIMVCDDFLKRESVEFQDFPYKLTYSFSEYEFHIDYPGTPGWGVSHYGRGNPDIARLLHILERVYARLYPARVPSFFRKE